MAVVTGANRGIGAEVARGLAAAGHRVLMVVRDLPSGEAARALIAVQADRDRAEVVYGDLSSQASVRTLASDLTRRTARVDVLVHNAALLTSARVESADGIELQFQVNHLAPWLLTRLCLPALNAGVAARIVVVSSDAHRRARSWRPTGPDARYAPYRVYAGTKLANILFTRALARRLEGQTVTVNAVHPGRVSTRLLGGLLGPLSPLRALARPPAAGAAPVLRLALDPHLSAVSGAYFHRLRNIQPAEAARDPKSEEELWALSAEWSGETLEADGC